MRECPTSKELKMLIELPRTGRIRSFEDAKRDPRATPEVRAALETFERMLHPDWDGWVTGRQLANRFFVVLQHCPTVEGVRLARLVDELTRRTEERLLRSLVRRLLGSTEWSDYVAGSMALSFLALLARAGRSAVPIAEGNALSADVEAILHLRPVTVEMKAMHTTADARLFDDLMDAILDEGVDLGSLVGHIPVVPPRETHAPIASEVARIFSQPGPSTQVSIGKGSVRRRQNDTELLLGPASKVDRERLLDRIRNRKYVDQLDTVQGPTVLLVRSRSVFFGAEAHLLRQWLADLSEHLRRAPGLSAVIVVEEGGARLNYQAVRNVRLLVGLDPEDRVPRTVLLMSNEEARVPLTAEELDVLLSPSMCW